MKYRNTNKCFKEIKNQLKEKKEKIRIIRIGSKYPIVKCFKIGLLFLEPFGIIRILRCLVTKSLLRKSYLQNLKKPFWIQEVQDKLVILSFIALVVVLFLNYRSCWILIFVGWRVSEILVVQLSMVLLSENNEITTDNFNRSIFYF